MRTRALIGIGLATGLGVSGVLHGQSSTVQWRAADGGNGHWYQVVREPSGITWTDASSIATSRGGHLATIHSAAENAVVFQLAGPTSSWPNGNGPFLGGLQDPDSSEPTGGWRWVTGEPWNFTSWLGSEPNNSCFGTPEDRVVFGAFSTGWNDTPDDTRTCAPLSMTWSLAIEWSADCNGDGIVDFGQCRDGSLPDHDGNNVPDCCENGVPCISGTYPVRWRIEDGGNGHWYRGVRTPTVISWTAARQAADSAGGHLATATSGPECDWLHALAGNASLWLGRVGPWLGGYQDPGAVGYSEPSGGWRWVTGEAWFPRWGPNEPNNAGGSEGLLHFISLNCSDPLPGRHWNDIHPGPGAGCEPISPSYLVEWSADCDGNGIIDYGEILDGTLADTNANGVPDCCDSGVSCDPCPGDLNDSNTVDAEDLAPILFAWGTDGGKTPEADINRDGAVDANDLSVVLGSWGPCP